MLARSYFSLSDYDRCYKTLFESILCKGILEIGPTLFENPELYLSIPGKENGLFLGAKCCKYLDNLEDASMLLEFLLQIEPLNFPAYQELSGLRKAQEASQYYGYKVIQNDNPENNEVVLSVPGFSGEPTVIVFPERELNEVEEEISLCIPSKRSATDEGDPEREDSELDVCSFIEPLSLSSRGKARKSHVSQVVKAVSEPFVVFSVLGKAIRFLKMSELVKSRKALLELDTSNFQTHFVFCCLGRSFFNQMLYKEAVEWYSKAFRIDPFGRDGLTLYSSALWHMKMTSELLDLSLRTKPLLNSSPEALLVLANLHSLRKEHTEALKFIKKALEIDDRLVYGHILRGHEIMCNEDFEGAVEAFRNAVHLDKYSFSAYFGLGAVFLRQEKYSEALRHFELSRMLNPKNAVIRCYTGMCMFLSFKKSSNKGFGVEGTQRVYESILSELESSLSLNKHYSMARFQKAKVLIEMGRLEEAKDELLRVQEIAPKETAVLVMLGKVCANLGERSLALKHFDTCLSHNPADANMVKAEMDSCLG